MIIGSFYEVDGYTATAKDTLKLKPPIADAEEVIKSIKNITSDDKYSLRDINVNRFSYKVQNGDFALLKKADERYLFHQINKHWIAIDKTTYSNIEKSVLLGKHINRLLRN